MKRILAIMISILLCCLVLSGCGRKNDVIITTELDSRFKIISDTNDGVGYCNIIVDTETGVMYLFRGAGYRGGLTVMVDADGKPLLYEGDFL